jgi:56kDa selenium binding protein (SBP56)
VLRSCQFGSNPGVGRTVWIRATPLPGAGLRAERLRRGFDIEDVGAGRYGQRLHFWDLAERRLEQTLDLGQAGLVPLEVRWLHDPEAEQGFVGATLASNIVRFHRSNGGFRAESVIEVDTRSSRGGRCPAACPG